MKWNRHLEDDPALFELASRGEVWGRAVTERFDHDLIVAGASEPGQRPAYIRAGHAVEVASDDHEARIPAIGEPAGPGRLIDVGAWLARFVLFLHLGSPSGRRYIRLS